MQDYETQQTVFPIKKSQHWVGGEWQTCTEGQAYISYNPSSGEPLLQFEVTSDLIDLAVCQTADSISYTDVLDFSARRDALKQLRGNLHDQQDVVVQRLMMEVGKPSWEAQHDVSSALRYLDRLNDQEDLEACFRGSAMAGRDSDDRLEMHPIGLVAGYVSFSDPLMNFISYVSSAVLAGNPILVVSSVHSAWVVQGFVDLITNLDLPKGCISVVLGGYQEFRRVVANNRVRVALYTGSAEHCDELLHNTRSINDCQMLFQAGGKNATVVHSSADIDHAVRVVAYGVIKSAGQSCFSTSRVYVYRSIFPRFYQKLSEVLSRISVGRTDQGLQNDVVMGPLCSQKAVTRFLRFQTMGAREAKDTPLWGKKLQRGSGNLVLPGLHLMDDDIRTNTAYRSTVQFGPDLAVYSYDVLADVFAQVNRYPSLSLSFVGEAEALSQRLSQIDVPNIKVNLPSCGLGVTPSAPYRPSSSLQHVHSPMNVNHMVCFQSIESSQRSLDLFAKWPNL